MACGGSRRPTRPTVPRSSASPTSWCRSYGGAWAGRSRPMSSRRCTRRTEPTGASRSPPASRRATRPPGTRRPSPAPSARPLRLIAVLAIGLLALLRLLLVGLPRLRRLQLGGDQSVVLGPQVDLVVVVGGDRADALR